MKPEISIIIPALNEEDSIRETLCSLQVFDHAEIIVVDGGSTDATVSIAEDFGVKILHAPRRGRGAQLEAGGTAAKGAVLWFLHADTRVSPGSVRQIKLALKDSRIAGGNFTIRFDGERLAAKFLTWLYPQLRHLGLIYGDSAIFVRREIYQKMGGFAPFPIFEDLDFVERLKRQGEIATLPAVVTTSSRRFENKSFILIFLRWTILQVLYWLGVHPDTLVKIYFPSAK
ncbi:MAG TPA: TIGR04283 family arsenosugar biosynthesis glycosyltransferase [Pyrinomonadaceae bacterium]|jgi:rSAM/selenodomain-associated transferase 2|nr:TIGR04283 family arsenosugar biosynthesis glycosyltransferase [Pyrinomonadaceae bacterium]